VHLELIKETSIRKYSLWRNKTAAKCMHVAQIRNIAERSILKGSLIDFLIKLSSTNARYTRNKMGRY